MSAACIAILSDMLEDCASQLAATNEETVGIYTVIPLRTNTNSELKQGFEVTDIKTSTKKHAKHAKIKSRVH